MRTHYKIESRVGFAAACCLLLALVLVPVKASAEKTYLAGKILDIKTVDRPFPLYLPNGKTAKARIGILHQYIIQSGDLLYIGLCDDKKFKACGTEWKVNDAVRFRVKKHLMFIRRNSGKELELQFGGTVDKSVLHK